MDYYTKALKNYAVFNGRATRTEYWMFVLINTLIYIFIILVIGMINNDLASVMLGLYGLAIIIPALTISVRRMHDIGMSGWTLLVLLLPVIGGLLVLIYTIRDSEPGTNRFGPNPKEGGMTPTV